MADPEVVVRLLAAIDEREREYHRCAEELREAARAKMRLPHTEFLRATVGDGLRLCQSHRDIVAQYERTLEASKGRRDLAQSGALLALYGVIRALARGYGVESSRWPSGVADGSISVATALEGQKHALYGEHRPREGDDL